MKSNQKRLTQFENEERYTVNEMSVEMTHTILMTKGPEAPEFNDEEERNFGNTFTKFEYYLYNFWFFM